MAAEESRQAGGDRKAWEGGRVLTLASIDEPTFESIFKEVSKVVREAGREDLDDALRYILNELLRNAEKANLKRVYFKNKGLDINDPLQYALGMKTFMEELGSDDDLLRVTLPLSDLRVSLLLGKDKSALYLRVANNVLPTPSEWNRIQERLTLGGSLDDESDVYTPAYDSTEGAGFGVITVSLMLRSLGIYTESLRYTLDPQCGETQVEVRVPFDAIPEQDVTTISEKVNREIRQIPKLPERVWDLEKKLRDPDVSILDIAHTVARDPALSAELLRLVNSSYYARDARVTRIDQAVSLVGMSGIRNLLYAQGAFHALESKYSKLKELFEHSVMCALCASALSKRLGMRRAEDAYVIGILHDIGKIVLLTLHPETMKGIARHCSSRRISKNLLEGLLLGVGHATVGALMLRQWNLPEQLLVPIHYHHQPALAPAEHKDMARLIFLADGLANRLAQTGKGEGMDERQMEQLLSEETEGVTDLWG